VSGASRAAGLLIAIAVALACAGCTRRDAGAHQREPPGYTFAASDGGDAHLRGNHGAPAETDVSVVALGGVAAGDHCDDIHAADVGRTLLSCLGLPDVGRLDHGPVPTGSQGRVLRGLCKTAIATAVPTP